MCCWLLCFSVPQLSLAVTPCQLNGLCNCNCLLPLPRFGVLQLDQQSRVDAHFYKRAHTQEPQSHTPTLTHSMYRPTLYSSQHSLTSAVIGLISREAHRTLHWWRESSAGSNTVSSAPSASATNRYDPLNW